MGTWFFSGSLNRFLGQSVTQSAFAASVSKFGVFEMAQKAGFFRDLKMLFFAVVLVAGSAVELVALDRGLLLQMGGV